MRSYLYQMDILEGASADSPVVSESVTTTVRFGCDLFIPLLYRYQ